ncbi:RNA helicase required for poly(A+) mRNA export [Rhodotorula mucilaginosa]|uniref:RNA helicase n=1 Tax=Rhodotorula mucilaginosa TaxID=5537 RepID=A0A9P7B5Z3_RHOMI|nr:RNA helicase required for poly(A+) mRNA export [Rhodotorula mucilaginosa]
MASDAVSSLSARLSSLDPTAEAKEPAPAPAQTETANTDSQEAPQENGEAAETPQASSLLENLSHEVQVTLADQQADPNSPLFSAKSFEDLNLHPNLLKGIYKMGYQKPSKIQEKALPLLLQNPARNMIGQSQSGTGKTAAFALTMLSRIDMDLKAPQAICIAPSRELAMQILQVVQRMGEYTPVECFFAGKDSWTKGMPKLTQQVIIGTPGTMIDMVTKGRILDLREVKVFVLDEADNMLESGSMGDQSITLKNLITKMAKNPQIVLFSATFADVVRNFAVRFAPNANEIRLKQEELSLDAIKQFFMDCDNEQHKYEVLVELYNLLTIGQSIIFVKRRDTADEIARRMSAEGHKVVSLHGKLETTERDAVMESFREGKTKVLITTNVIARGIDISQVNMVVNYDLPLDANNRPDPETYLHRRTGRFGRQGVSINFVHDRTSFENMEAIRKALGKPIVRVDTSDFEQMEATLKAALKS